MIKGYALLSLTLCLAAGCENVGKEAVKPLAARLGEFNNEIAQLRKEAVPESEKWRDLLHRYADSLFERESVPFQNVLREMELSVGQMTGTASNLIGCTADSIFDRVQHSTDVMLREFAARENEIRRGNTDEAVLAILKAIAAKIPPTATICAMDPLAVTIDADGKTLVSGGMVTLRGVALPLGGEDVTVEVNVANSDGSERKLDGAEVSYTAKRETRVDISRVTFKPGDQQIKFYLVRGAESRSPSHDFPIMLKAQEEFKDIFFKPPALSLEGPRIQNQSGKAVFPSSWSFQDIEELRTFENQWKTCLGKLPQKKVKGTGPYRPHYDGDEDFDGHGPLVIVRVHLFQKRTTLEASVSLWAMEWENDVPGVPHEDYTCVAGGDLFPLPVPAVEEGYEILKILDPPVPMSCAAYVDSDHDNDEPGPNGGPVTRFICVGDTPGDDTADVKVTVEWKELKIRCQRIKK